MSVTKSPLRHVRVRDPVAVGPHREGASIRRPRSRGLHPSLTGRAHFLTVVGRKALPLLRRWPPGLVALTLPYLRTRRRRTHRRAGEIEERAGPDARPDDGEDEDGHRAPASAVGCGPEQSRGASGPARWRGGEVRLCESISIPFLLACVLAMLCCSTEFLLVPRSVRLSVPVTCWYMPPAEH